MDVVLPLLTAVLWSLTVSGCLATLLAITVLVFPGGDRAVTWHSLTVMTAWGAAVVFAAELVGLLLG